MSIVKLYYRIAFELQSPLAIGSGEGVLSDSDALLDDRGIPYIPGSSLAGVYRSLFSRDTADLYFGPELSREQIKKSSEEGKNVLKDSSVLVYDAMIQNPGKQVLTVRDMVALDEYKTGIPGAKFDFQVVEPGVRFVTYLEQNINILTGPAHQNTRGGKYDEEYLLAEIAYAWMQGGIRLGAKTGRGYGRTRGVEAKKCRFNLEDPDALDAWLKFDMYDDAGWESADTVKFLSGAMQNSSDRNCRENADTEKHLSGTVQNSPDKSCKEEEDAIECLSDAEKGTKKYDDLVESYELAGISLREKKTYNIRLSLEQTGPVSIRQYSSDVGDADKHKAEPDYMQMKLADGTPVIPGTSWAGAFRAQMEKLNLEFGRGTELAGLFFGKVKGTDKLSGHKTRISFSESALSEGHWVTYTRNAIDRFSGGAVDKSLYTEKNYVCGKTEVEISCDFTDVEENKVRSFLQVLTAAVLDLHEGYMAVGGLTSVGHGMFRVKEIFRDGVPVGFSQMDHRNMYRELLEALS